MMPQRISRWLAVISLFGVAAQGVSQELRFAKPFEKARERSTADELSTSMIAGLDRFLDRQLEESLAHRTILWGGEPKNGRVDKSVTDIEAFEAAAIKKRQRLKEILGAVDTRVASPKLECLDILTSSVDESSDNTNYRIRSVRWPVMPGVYGEGLLLEPNHDTRAMVVAIPDADQIPEDVAGLRASLEREDPFARRLVEQGCCVLIPVLLSRETTFSGHAATNRWTNLSHREWIWRMAFEVGRTPMGYEVLKILSGTEALENYLVDRKIDSARIQLPIGLAGYGEGGRVALFAAALDSKVDAAWVVGALDSRQKTWQEPADRTIWSYLSEFGDAEVASLVAPRTLIIEHTRGPLVEGPTPSTPQQRSIAAPGSLVGTTFESVWNECERARRLCKPWDAQLHCVDGTLEGAAGARPDTATRLFLLALGIDLRAPSLPSSVQPSIGREEAWKLRQERTVKELEAYTQQLVNTCERTRAQEFWNPIQARSAEDWEEMREVHRKRFDEVVIGKWERKKQAMAVEYRRALDANGAELVESQASFTAWDIRIPMDDDVFAWGVLLLPKDLLSATPRPVVICQHGLEGLPESCITTDESSKAWRAYKAFARQLVERGFIVFVPHNPYRGGDAFRVLQRKSWLLGRHLFSLIHLQHAAILDWLEQQPYVDPNRMAFYGLSYGGKSAMRIPAVETRYCLSICSGDFNEWVRKNAMTEYPTGYLYTHEYEIFEWNLGHTLNYAEMAALIAPRPFMVEHGLKDRVSMPEWAAYEYAKVRKFYMQLGVADRTDFEFFDGPHTIHGKGTFEFLHRHLRWPEK